MSEKQQLAVSSQIETVVVYPDRARVTRRGTVELTPETTQLVFSELPLTLLPDSVRVSGRGTARVRISGVDLRRAFYQETPAERARELEAAIEALQDDNRVLEDQGRMLDAQLKYLDGLREATREYARGLARGQSTVAEQTSLLAFLRQGDEEVYGGKRELAVKQRQLARQIQKLQQELKTIQSSRPRQRFEAVVEIVVSSAGSFTPALTYVVQRAQWQPLYDVRLLEHDGKRMVNLTQLAQISQQSGEDWQGVKVTVSTARPALNQRMPEIQPWYVDAYVPPPPVPQPAPRRKAAARLMRADAEPEMVTSAAPMAADAVMEEVAAEVVTATVRADDISVSFELPGGIDIPSDGSPRKVTVGESEMEPKLDFVTIPRHTDAVYRRVTIANSSGAPLLAGAVSLFVDEAFIGSNRLDYVPGGADIELLFGVEERIKVERELSRREVDKRFLSDKRQLRYGYEIKLHNLLDREAALVVKDQLPVSRHEEIAVKLTAATPSPTEQSDLNIMEWQLALAAGGKTAIGYEYMVEHPRQLQVTGLLD